MGKVIAIGIMLQLLFHAEEVKGKLIIDEEPTNYLLFQDYECINMPTNISFCHNGYYSRIRLPNAFDENKLSDIRKSLNMWSLILRTNCHPGMFPCIFAIHIFCDSQLYTCLCYKLLQDIFIYSEFSPKIRGSDPKAQGNIHYLEYEGIRVAKPRAPEKI